MTVSPTATAAMQQQHSADQPPPRGRAASIGQGVAGQHAQPGRPADVDVRHVAGEKGRELHHHREKPELTHGVPSANSAAGGGQRALGILEIHVRRVADSECRGVMRGVVPGQRGKKSAPVASNGAEPEPRDNVHREQLQRMQRRPGLDDSV